MRVVEAQHHNCVTYGRVGYESRRTLAKYDNVYPTEARGAWHDYIDRRTLVATSRQFRRDNSIYQGILTQSVNYVVGDEGFQLQVRTKNKRWNAACEKFWLDFIRDADASGYYSGMPLERVLFPELILTGECLLLPQDTGKLQIIESEQITSNGLNDLDAIKLDIYGRPMSFEICPYGISGLDIANRSTFDASDVIFCAIKDRPSCVRGMPILQAAFPMLLRLNDVLDAEVHAWYMQACIALASSTENPISLNTEDERDADEFTVTKFDYGMYFKGAAGDKLEGLVRTAPNRDLAMASSTLLRFVGLPLGLPLELVLMDWTKSNFSQSRAVLQQLRQNFTQLQQLVIRKIMVPIYEWRISKAMQEGDLPPNNGWQEIEFVPPPFPSLDPKQESEAYGQQIDRALTTKARLLKSLGYDYEELTEERQAEIGDCMRRAGELERIHGQKVPWEILYGLNANTSYNKPEADALIELKQEQENEVPSE